MSNAKNSKLAINNALKLLGRKPAGESSKDSTPVLPTGRTRKALDLLEDSTPQSLQDNRVAIKPLLQDLFNWKGGNKVNKPLIRAFGEAINTPGKYPQAVELTAFLAGMAPMLEADQIARMYTVVDKVETAFAPAKYTMQLYNMLHSVFGEFSPERRERLSFSLWEESHQGRWWNLTTGLDMAPNLVEEELEDITAEEIFESIKKVFYENRSRDMFNGNTLVDWNPTYQRVFAQTPMSTEIAELSEEYSEKLRDGEHVHPDIAVYLSSLPWLAPYQRPESPVGGLLKFLNHVLESIGDDIPRPKKPRSFSELFPNVYLQEGAYNKYPIYPHLEHLDGKKIGEHRVSVIKNRVALTENAQYMGNCTASYEGRIKKGSQTMLFTDNGEIQHNVLVTMNKNGTWKLGEVNTRYNRGNNDQELRQAFQNYVDTMPPADEKFHNYLSFMESSDKSFKYSYSLY